MEALRYSAADVDTVVRLVELHLRFHTYRLGWTDRAVRRYVRDAGEHLARLNELTRCDCTTRNASKARALARRMDELEARITELGEEEELSRLRPDLTGNQVMELLGIPPGPAIGRALAFLMELRLDVGPLGEEEAGRRLVRWWRAEAEARSGRPSVDRPDLRPGHRGRRTPPGPGPGHVVVVLHRRRLHEVGRGAQQRSADAFRSSAQFGAAHGIDDHAGRVGRRSHTSSLSSRFKGTSPKLRPSMRM